MVPDEKSEKISQQKIFLISLVSAFTFCELGRGVVGSEPFWRIPSPYSPVGWRIFVYVDCPHCACIQKTASQISQLSRLQISRKVDSQLQSRIRLHVSQDSFLIYNCVPRKLNNP